jgi:hypothetical protein
MLHVPGVKMTIETGKTNQGRRKIAECRTAAVVGEMQSRSTNDAPARNLECRVSESPLFPLAAHLSLSIPNSSNDGFTTLGKSFNDNLLGGAFGRPQLNRNEQFNRGLHR